MKLKGVKSSIEKKGKLVIKKEKKLVIIKINQIIIKKECLKRLVNLYLDTKIIMKKMRRSNQAFSIVVISIFSKIMTINKQKIKIRILCQGQTLACLLIIKTDLEIKMDRII